MTKKEIVRTLSTVIGMTQMETKEIVQKTFAAIVDALVEGGAPTATERGGRIELRNFGVFEIKRRARAGPATRAPRHRVSVPQKFVVTFKPGKEMEDRVKELERQAAEKGRLSADGQASAAEMKPE